MKPAKIVVISDTHIPSQAKDLPAKIYEELKETDLIIHAGDITTMDLIKKLAKFAPLKAVCGNMDDQEIRKNLPAKEKFLIGGFSIGLMHGAGHPLSLLELVEKEFLPPQKPDIIIFGHSHKPLNIKKNGTVFFNPGSPTDKVFTDTNTYGIITINDKINAKIVEI